MNIGLQGGRISFDESLFAGRGSMVAKREWDYIFNPQSVAIAGVSANQTTVPGAGQGFLEAVIDYGFKGKVYPLNPKGGAIKGLKMYANIKDVPESVDYVISCVPASATPQLIKDCAAKRVKAVHFFTSGFSETGTEEGKQLEKEICSLARQGGIRIIGPNCIGVYCPQGNLSFIGNFPKRRGSVALICQSGGNTTYIIREAGRRGVRFSKAVSYGNAADINESDLLEYLAADPDTGIILAYIEGVKDGQRFSRVLKETAKVKPVIVLKGGISETGARAAASHTGVLAGSERVWDGLLRQAGAIRVYSLEELIDMAVSFSYLPLPLGRRVGILGIGGGATVLATDDCASAGLVVPRFPEEIRRRLSNLLGTEAGTILNNPVDLAAGAWDSGFYNTLNILANYEGVDLSMVHFPLGLLVFPPTQHNVIWDLLVDDVVKGHRELAKPVIVVIHIPTSGGDYEWMLETQRKFYKTGIPVYHSIGSAAKAIDRFLSYHEHKSA